jgi:hypothetical protein
VAPAEDPGVDQVAAAASHAPTADAVRREVVVDLAAVAVGADLEPGPGVVAAGRGDDLEEQAEGAGEAAGRRLVAGAAVGVEAQAQGVSAAIRSRRATAAASSGAPLWVPRRERRDSRTVRARSRSDGSSRVPGGKRRHFASQSASVCGLPSSSAAVFGSRVLTKAWTIRRSPRAGLRSEVQGEESAVSAALTVLCFMIRYYSHS